MNIDDVMWLNEMKHCKSFKKGELIFKEGHYPKGLFCVHAGKMKVAQLGDDGKEQIVHLIHNGSIMGHRAILGDDQYSCSSMAIEDSQACFIPKDTFQRMLDGNAKLALQQTIDVLVTREDLANLAGTTREPATRYLYEFQTNAIIELHKKHIKVVHLKRLIEYSHSK